MELLNLGVFTDLPQQVTRSLLSRLQGIRGDKNDSGKSKESAESRTLYPCPITSLSREGGVKLYAESEEVRSRWREKLQEAIENRKEVLKETAVLGLEMLNSNSFKTTSTKSSTHLKLGRGQQADVGRVTCSVPFSKFLNDDSHPLSSDRIPRYHSDGG